MDDSNPIFPLRPPIVDDRGEIKHLVDALFGSALVITSVKGSIRGNHYHKTDYHYSWLQRGGLIYVQRSLEDANPPKRWVVTPGQLIYTPPMLEHAMYFTEDSVLIVFARNGRQMESYEADTIRVQLMKLSEVP